MLELEFVLEFCFMIFQEMEHVLQELELGSFCMFFYELVHVVQKAPCMLLKGTMLACIEAMDSLTHQL